MPRLRSYQRKKAGGILPTMSRTRLTPVVHVWTRFGRHLFGGSYGRVDIRVPEPEDLIVDAGTEKLHALRWRGPGPAMVLLHGLNNNAWAWARVAAVLAAQRDVISLSLRGHGRSTAPGTGYSLADTTSDILAVLHRLDLGAVDLAGHSWGGRVAMHVAITAPDRIRSLILADPVPPRGLNVVLRAFPALVEAALRPERGPFRNRAALEAGGKALPYFLRWDALEQRCWFESFHQEPDGSWHHRLPESGYREILEIALREDLTPRLHAIGCPVLWMRPTFSVAFWPGEIATAKRVLRDLEVRRIPGDHQFILTNPRDTAGAILAFLSR